MAMIRCVVCNCTGLEFRHICARCRDIEADETAALQADHDAAATLRAKLAAAERQRDEAVKLLREWGGPSPCRDAAGTLTPMIEHVRDLTERTEAYLAGVQDG